MGYWVIRQVDIFSMEGSEVICIEHLTFLTEMMCWEEN